MVSAIEVDRRLACVAQKKGVDVIVGDIEAPLLDGRLAGREFDLILCADVLEHLKDPVAALRRNMQLLKLGGEVLVSVPNFQRLDAIWALVSGHWKREDAGLFDRTHLQITTESVVRGWFNECGLSLEKVRRNYWGRRYRWPAFLSLGLLRRYCAAQVLCVGRKLVG
jgi:2-polyprenyl-3-methyl-5-hydroxy-6-metoxy-1,4-benzoquinol methylase